MTGTAIGFVITCGWAGLAVSSRIIGAIAGGDPLRLKKALLLIPAFGGVDGGAERGDLVGAAVGGGIVLLRDLKGQTGET